MIDQLIEIDLSSIRLNPYQPRKKFSQEELQELADSILEVGLLHPPLVRPVGNSGQYEIVSGERRFRAAQRAGLARISVLVRSASDEQSAQAALVENVQRVDLHPLEISRSLQRLMHDFGYGQEELAHKVGKKRSTVANYLRLNDLPQQIKDSLASGEITMGHAKALLSCKDDEEMRTLHQQIVSEKLSVREAETAPRTVKPVERDLHVEDLTRRLEQHLGTQVSIKSRGKKGGTITLSYFDYEDLDRLLEAIGLTSVV